jgi:hypothetical protein
MRALKLLAAAALVHFAVSVSAQTLLVGITNHNWRYFATTGGDPGVGWQNVGFDDSTWLEGRGLFGNDTGYPYPFVSTFAGPSTGGPLVSFYRTTFNWVGSLSGVVFNITNYFDDGVVFYLNGSEITRFNMPAGPADQTTMAPGTLGEPVLRIHQVPLDGLTNLNPNPLVAGVNVLAASVHNNATTSSDSVFGAAVLATQSVAPCTDGIQPTDRVIVERRSTTFTVVEQCAIPGATIQWYRNVGGGEELIVGATGASYTLSNAVIADSGTYYARLTNTRGSVDSRQATLTVQPDVEGPLLLSARVIGPGFRTFQLITDEELCGVPLDCGGDYSFGFNWQIIQSDDPLVDLGVAGVIRINATTYEFTSNFDRDPTKQYQITVAPGFGDNIFDLGGIPAVQGAFAETGLQVTFQQNDANGYTGTQDAEIHSNATADTTLGTTQPNQMGADLDDAGIAQSLLRFDNIFGPGPNQIPPGSRIVSATVTLNQIDPGAENRIHRMLVSFGDQNTVTWNLMGAGVTADDVEARVAFDSAKAAGVANGAVTFDVTASLQAWSDGQPNHGWVFLSQGTDGWDVNTSESGASSAPLLAVDYATVPCTGTPVILAQPPSTLTPNELSAFSITVGVSNACGSLQWTKDGADIPGANSLTYSVSSATPAADNGRYALRATNPGGSVTSSECVVTVEPKTSRPRVTRVASSANGTTITVAFNEPVSTASAQNAANYTLTPAVAVSSAVLGANNTVTLTTGARSVGTAYSLRITGVTDISSSANLIDPNPTVVALTTASVVPGAGFGGTWLYNSNNLDSTAGAWNTVGYVPDATWGSGPAAFGIETSAAVIGAAPTPIMTALSANSVAPGDQLTTTYFRRDITLPALPAGARFVICHYTDDGHITYLDGVELYRFGMPAGAVTFTNRSTGIPNGGEASMRSFAFTASPGAHVLAVELHQAGTTSSDVWFDMEVRILGTGTPSLSISRNTPPDRTLNLRWNADANWQLRSSATVNGQFNNVGIPAGTALGNFLIPLPGATNGNNFYLLDYICLP